MDQPANDILLVLRLDAVAKRVFYLQEILNTETYEHVTRVIESFRTTLQGHKTWQEIPI